MIGALLNLIGGASASLASLSSLPVVGSLIVLLATRGGRIVMFGGMAALIYGVGYWKGDAAASGACEARALRAALQATAIDRDAANERAARSALVIKGLRAADDAHQRRIAQLIEELARAAPQSTKPGAKVDANALIDDQCRYTAAGARRLRR
jgi:hypothetical protein